MAQTLIKARAEGQLRGHPRRRDRPELRVPALGHDRRRHPEAQRDERRPGSRSCSRRTPTTGIPRTPRTTWKRRSTRTATRSTPSCPRTTAWRPASSRRSTAVGLKVPVSRPGRRHRRAEPRRPRHPGRLGLEERVRPRRDGRRASRCSSAAAPRSTAVKAPSDLPAAAAPAILTATPFTTPGSNTVQSIILTPTAITKANLKDTVDAGWVTKDAVCAGVTAGSTPALLIRSA